MTGKRKAVAIHDDRTPPKDITLLNDVSSINKKSRKKSVIDASTSSISYIPVSTVPFTRVLTNNKSNAYSHSSCLISTSPNKKKIVLPSQLAVFQKLTQFLNVQSHHSISTFSSPSSSQILFLSGPTGSGKDFIIQDVSQTYKNQVDVLEINQLNVIDQIKGFVDGNSSKATLAKLAQACMAFIDQWNSGSCWNSLLGPNSISNTNKEVSAQKVVWFRDIDHKWWSDSFDMHKMFQLIQNSVLNTHKSNSNNNTRINKNTVKWIFSVSEHDRAKIFKKPILDILASLEKSNVNAMLHINVKPLQMEDLQILKWHTNPRIIAMWKHNPYFGPLQTEQQQCHLLSVNYTKPEEIAIQKSGSNNNNNNKNTTSILNSTNSVSNVFEAAQKILQSDRESLSFVEWSLQQTFQSSTSSKDSLDLNLLPHLLVLQLKKGLLISGNWSEWMERVTTAEKMCELKQKYRQYLTKDILQILQTYCVFERTKSQQAPVNYIGMNGWWQHHVACEMLFRYVSSSNQHAVELNRINLHHSHLSTNELSIRDWMTHIGNHKSAILKRSNTVLRLCPPIFGHSLPDRVQICYFIWKFHKSCTKNVDIFNPSSWSVLLNLTQLEAEMKEIKGKQHIQSSCSKDFPSFIELQKFDLV